MAIDPDVVAAQVEGAIGFALAIPLRNQITFKEVWWSKVTPMITSRRASAKCLTCKFTS